MHNQDVDAVHSCRQQMAGAAAALDDYARRGAQEPAPLQGHAAELHEQARPAQQHFDEKSCQSLSMPA